MKLHNQMEEYVETRVKDIYKKLEDEKSPWVKCCCEVCVLDSICYVLNRVTPRYIVSGREATFSSQALYDYQLKADIDALAIEAIKVINSVQRPYHKVFIDNKNNDVLREAMPSFNFPLFTGGVFDGNTFEPIIGATVTLRDNNGLVKMQDSSWDNPVKTYKTTGASFSFWPQSITAQKVNMSKKFMFIAEASVPGYQDSLQTFEITLTSEEKMRSFISNSLAVKMADFVMFSESD